MKQPQQDSSVPMYPAIFRIMLCALALTVGQAATAAEVYTWTDENGVVHFSDAPPESGESATLQVEEIPSLRCPLRSSGASKSSAIVPSVRRKPLRRNGSAGFTASVWNRWNRRGASSTPMSGANRFAWTTTGAWP